MFFSLSPGAHVNLLIVLWDFVIFKNIVTAIAIPAVLAMFFFKVPVYLNQPAVVGTVAQSSAAAQAGLLPGDRIVKFDNKDNPNWHDVEIKSEINPGTPLPLVID